MNRNDSNGKLSSLQLGGLQTISVNQSFNSGMKFGNDNKDQKLTKEEDLERKLYSNEEARLIRGEHIIEQ